MRWNRLAALCAGLVVAAPAWAGSFTYTLLAAPNSTGTGLAGLTDQDVVVGTAYFSGGAASQGVVFENGAATLVPATTGFTAVSSNGIAIGKILSDGYATYNLAGGKFKTYKLNTRPAKIVTPHGINAPGLGIATANNKKNTYGLVFAMQGNAVLMLPPAPGCAGYSVSVINDAGLIGGTCYTSNGAAEGYIDQNGSAFAISVPNSSQTNLFAVSHDGSVGGNFDGSSGYHGFTYAGGNFTQIDVPGGNSASVYAFGPGGEIGGYYYPTGAGGLNYVGFIEVNGAYHEISPAAYPTGITVTAINALGSLLLSLYPNQTILAQCPQNQQPCTQ